MSVMDIFRGGVGSSPSTTPFANAASGGGIQPVGGRRYNAFLDPQGPVPIGNLIGSLTGAPTREQATNRQTGAAIAGIAKYMQKNGGNYQAAVNEWAVSPEGQDFFINDGDFSKLDQYSAQMAASPQGPGTMMMGPGGDTFGEGVPTTAEQELVALLGGAALNPEQERAVYRAALAAQNVPDTSEDERLYQELERVGMMTHEQGLRIRSFDKRYVKVPITNANKEVVGLEIRDLLGEDAPLKFETNTGQLGKLAPPQIGGTMGNQALGGPDLTAQPHIGQGPATQGEVIQEPPIEEASGPSYEPGSGNFGINPDAQVSGDIVQGAGLANAATAAVGRLWGQVFSDFTGATAAKKLQAMEQIRTDFAGMATGRLKGLFDRVDKLANATGWNTNVEVAANQLIAIRQAAESKAAQLARHYANESLSTETRNNLLEDYLAIEYALLNVPSVGSLELQIGNYKANPQGSIPQAVNEAVGASSQAQEDISGVLGGEAPGASGPAVGTVEDGYVFLGGDAADPANWEPVR